MYPALSKVVLCQKILNRIASMQTKRIVTLLVVSEMRLRKDNDLVLANLYEFVLVFVGL